MDMEKKYKRNFSKKIFFKMLNKADLKKLFEIWKKNCNK